MRIQSVKESDKDQLFQMHEICFREHIEQIWGWETEWQVNHFNQEWKNGNWMALTDEADGGKIIGYLMWKEKEDHVYLANVSLLPEYRNQGLGTQAMQYIISRADSLNVGVKLSIFRTNDRVLPFYQRLGFCVIKQEENGKLLHRPRT